MIKTVVSWIYSPDFDFFQTSVLSNCAESVTPHVSLTFKDCRKPGRQEWKNKERKGGGGKHSLERKEYNKKNNNMCLFARCTM